MLLFAGIALGGLIQFIIVLVLVLAAIFVLYWAINRLAPEPIRNVLTVLVVVFAALALIYYAASFFGVL